MSSKSIYERVNQSMGKLCTRIKSLYFPEANVPRQEYEFNVNEFYNLFLMLHLRLWGSEKDINKREEIWKEKIGSKYSSEKEMLEEMCRLTSQHIAANTLGAFQDPTDEVIENVVTYVAHNGDVDLYRTVMHNNNIVEREHKETSVKLLTSMTMAKRFLANLFIVSTGRIDVYVNATSLLQRTLKHDHSGQILSVGKNDSDITFYAESDTPNRDLHNFFSDYYDGYHVLNNIYGMYEEAGIRSRSKSYMIDLLKREGGKVVETKVDLYDMVSAILNVMPDAAFTASNGRGRSIFRNKIDQLTPYGTGYDPSKDYSTPRFGWSRFFYNMSVLPMIRRSTESMYFTFGTLYKAIFDNYQAASTCVMCNEMLHTKPIGKFVNTFDLWKLEDAPSKQLLLET